MNGFYLVRSFSPTKISGFLRGGRSVSTFLTRMTFVSPSSSDSTVTFLPSKSSITVPAFQTTSGSLSHILVPYNENKHKIIVKNND